MRYKTPEGIDQGEQFGSLIVVRFLRRNPRYQAVFEVRCACGSLTEVLGTNLKKGNTTQCDAGVHRATHGSTNSAEYIAWKAMKWRVKSQQPNVAPYYFNKGITIFPKWKVSFPAFLEHIGPMPHQGSTVDRIDGNGNYEPGNVRWADRFQQAQNKAAVAKVVISGVARSLSEWARIAGLPLPTLVYRYRRGWPEHELLSKDKWRHRISRCA